MSKPPSLTRSAAEGQNEEKDAAAKKHTAMTNFDDNIELPVLEEEALQSIEKLLDELGREPSPLEVKFYNSYNKREPKRDEGYSRFNFPINQLQEGIAVQGTMFVRKGSKRMENPHRIMRNCFKLLTGLGSEAHAQFLSVHHAPLNTPENQENLDYLLTRMATYSNQIGLPTLDVHLKTDEQFGDYTLLNAVVIGTRAKKKRVEFNLANSKLVLLTPLYGNTDELQDVVLSKLYRKVHNDHTLVFMVSGRKGIAGQLLKHIKEYGYGVRFFKEGFDGFTDKLEDLLIRRFKTEIVMLTPDPGEIVKVATAYNVEARIIGEVSQESELQIVEKNRTLCQLPTEILRDEVSWESDEELQKQDDETGIDIESLKEPDDLREVAFRVLKALKRDEKMYAQSFFDNTVKANNMSLHFPSDAAIFKLHNQPQAIAFTVNTSFNPLVPHQTELTARSAAHSLRQIACCGTSVGRMISAVCIKNANTSASIDIGTENHSATANASDKLCADFGDYAFHFDHLRDGEMKLPEITVIHGGIGVLQDTSRQMSVPFKNKGDLIFLIGESTNCIASSLYLKEIHKIQDATMPYIDWSVEQALHEAVRGLIRESIICSARSVGEGGLFAALVDCCRKNQLGFDITSVADVRDDAFLFSEAHGRVLVSLTIHKRKRFIEFLESLQVSFTILGHVTKGELRIEDKSYGFINEIGKHF